MKQYVLKNQEWDPAKINRLLKKIKDNASDDRDTAKAILEQTQKAILDLGNPLQYITIGEESQASADTFYKLVQAAVHALNQMGIANERLLKLVQTLQKFKEKEDGASTPAEKNKVRGSLFEALKAAAEEDDD